MYVCLCRCVLDKDKRDWVRVVGVILVLASPVEDVHDFVDYQFIGLSHHSSQQDIIGLKIKEEAVVKKCPRNPGKE